MRWTYLKWSIAFWWGLAWTFPGVVLALVAGYQWNRYFATRDNFYEVHGTIAEKYHQSKSGKPALVVGYLARDAQPHTMTAIVSAADYEQYRLGGDVMLYVAGDDPGDAWLEASGARTTGVAWLLSGLCVMFLVPGPISLFFGITRSAARAATLASGQPMEGRIKGLASTGWTINRVRYFCYQYTWRGADGVEREGMSLPIHPARATKSAGDAVMVFVDPVAPERGEIKLDG